MNSLKAYAPAGFLGVSTNNGAIRRGGRRTDSAQRGTSSLLNRPGPDRPRKNRRPSRRDTLASMRPGQGLRRRPVGHWKRPHFRDAPVPVGPCYFRVLP